MFSDIQVCFFVFSGHKVVDVCQDNFTKINDGNMILLVN